MAVNPIKTPFTNMSFTPDVPSSALSDKEYNAGYNIITDVRSVKSVRGEEYILSSIPGNIIYVTSGFRANNVFWFIVATEQGKWYAVNAAGYTDITPSPVPGVIVSTTTYGNVAGTSSASSSGIYNNVAPVSTTGIGSNATFDITIFQSNAKYSGSNTSITIGNSVGHQFKVGDKITIGGNVLGGVYPDNNLTFTIISGLANIGGSFQSNSTGTGLTGNSSTSSKGTYTNVPVGTTSGFGNGAVFTVTIASNSIPYSMGGGIASNTTYTSISGTSSITANGYYPAVGSSTTGNGTGAIFNIRVNKNSTAYSSGANISLVNGGYGYALGDVISIPGANIGGTSTNGLSFVVANAVSNYGASLTSTTTISNYTGTSGASSVGTYNNVIQYGTSGVGAGAVFDFRVVTNGASYSNTSIITTIISGGYGYNIGDTITIAGNAIGGTFSTNNLTFKIASNVANYGGSLSSGTSFAFLTGTSGTAANGTYSSVAPYVTSGIGSGALFNVQVANSNASYTTSTITVASAGNNYAVGDTVVIPGSSLGGLTGPNDLTFTVNTFVSNASTTIHATTGGYGYNVGDTVTFFGNAIGGISGINDLTFTIASNVGNISGQLSKSTVFGNAQGTSSASSSDYYPAVTQKSTSGIGTGATFNVRVTGNNEVYGNVAVISIDAGGVNYKIGDTVTIAGNVLGGSTPANDLTFSLDTTLANYGGNFTGYSNNTVITASWNGSVVFMNDQLNPPMFLLPSAQTLSLYDQTPNLGGPGVGGTYTWNYDVGTNIDGNIVPLYSSLTAGFLRVYNSPNVGSLLVAGNLTGNINPGVVPGGGTVQYLPTTIRWSQNFGLNSGAETWAPTLTNVANEVEIPVRGPVIDGFSLAGNFYLFSYWDCVLMAPIAYTTTSAPVFGISKVTDGRGLINENCWAIVDQVAYGIDSSDIWQFSGGNFKEIGNQRVKNFFFGSINPLYVDQIFMVNNTYVNQIEIYYPDQDSTGRCNQMMSYRYDLDIWNPPRQVVEATAGCESPVWTGNVADLSSRGVVYSSGVGNVALVQKDVGTSFVGNTAISSLFKRDNISFGQPYSASVQVHRVYPEVYGTGNIDVTVGGSQSVAGNVLYRTTQTMPIVTDNPWVQINQNEARVTSIQMSANSAVDSWELSAVNWQVTVVQNTR
jgi:hypothetical protein